MDAPTAPLSPEDAYEVTVSYRAQGMFVRCHDGTREQAEAQIRSLLEDLLRDGRVQTNSEGRWALTTQLKYRLVLSPDASTVIAYHTKHAERTYAQVKSGVPSRVSTKRTRERQKRAALRAAEEA